MPTDSNNHHTDNRQQAAVMEQLGGSSAERLSRISVIPLKLQFIDIPVHIPKALSITISEDQSKVNNSFSSEENMSRKVISDPSFRLREIRLR